MQEFSRTLVELYQLAEHASPEDFPAGVMRLLRHWIGFDGAVFGMGENGGARLDIVQAHVHNRDAALLADYGAVSAIDPVTGHFLRGLQTPLAVDCRALYAARELHGLLDFTRKHDLRHLMLFGDTPQAGHPGRWLVLYRGTDRAFTPQEADYLHAAWFHVSRAIDISHARLLQQLELDQVQRRSALVSPRGTVEAADPHFFTLLEREWPGHSGKQLPAALWQQLERGQAYRGRQVEISGRQHDSFVVCLARPIATLAGLTPSEEAVARRFAAGLSAKEIARELGVSPHTVRSQLTRLYGKLDVHDKAALAQLLNASR